MIEMTTTELQVQHWATADRTVLTAAAAATARGEDLDTWFTNLVAAGAAAVTAAGAGTDLARLDAAMSRLDRDVQEATERMVTRLNQSVIQATDPEVGDVARAAQSAVDRLAAGVQRILTGTDALLPAAATKAVEQVTAHALAEIHRLLDADRQQLGAIVAADRERVAVELARSIGDQNAHLADVVAEMRAALTAHTVATAQQSSGPRKGLAYEDEVQVLLNRIAAAAGDGGADGIGTTPGIDNSRKGDVLVDLRSLPTQPRLVVEAKHRPGKAALGVRQWATELESALTARQAAVALGVCPREQMPGGAPVLVIDGRRAVVGWDPGDADDLLSAGYLLMRMAAGQQRRDHAVSPAELEEHVRAIAAGMAPLDEIRRQAGTCRKAAERIAETAHALRDDLATRIEAVQDRLKTAA